MKYLVLILGLCVLWSTTDAIKYSKDYISINTARIFYFRNDGTHYNYTLADAYKLPRHLQQDKPTVLYVHDHQESLLSESVEIMITAYHIKDEFNVMVLDWEQLAASKLYDAAINTHRIAPFLARSLIDMFDTELISINQLHLVGFGMGAHICGHASYLVRKETDNIKRIKRITALDPTFYPFYPPLVRHIEHDDALFVDVIHTDSWISGVPISTGTVDFWPNEGRAVQPGCPDHILSPLDGNSCNHRRAWRYWAESVAAGIEGCKRIFQAIKCSSWKTFILNSCYESNAYANMGLGAAYGLHGNYFLLTNARSRFSKGPQGTIYDQKFSIGKF